MKILRIISSVDPKGGGVIEGVRQLQEPLVRMGHDVDIACCDAPDAPWLCESEEGLNIYALGPSRFGYAFTSRLLPWLRKNVANYDAVIVEGIWQYHSFAVWLALAGKSTPYFVFTHGMLDPWFKRNYPLKHLKKCLYWPWAEYRVLRDARSVIFTCEEERLLARKSFWRTQWQEAISGYGTASAPTNGDELARRFLVANPDLGGKRVLLYLSRIHEKKGCDLLIAAFAKVAFLDPALHLVIAGPDQTGLVPRLQRQSKELGVSHRISWLGMLQGDEKWGAFHAAEVFCLPSHQENFGIVVAEALACATPVLISNKVNIWREIEGDGAGFVSDDTIEGTVDNLRRWINTTGYQKEGMGRAGLVSFQNRYQIDKVADSLIRIISEHNVDTSSNFKNQKDPVIK
jgi:glycosyltransferase involved in cell wall biosynthesis